MVSVPAWDTSCRDWEERLLSGRSLIPDLPLFEEEAARALRIFKRLRIPDMHGAPRMGDVAGPWLFPIVTAIFGSYDAGAEYRAIQEFFWLIPKKNTKALALDTLVATPSGVKTIAALRVGEYVIASDGKPAEVIEKSPVFINRECYEVEFSTGERVVCDAEHLWVTDAHRDREKLNPRNDRVRPRPSVKTTKEISTTLKVASGRYEINNHRTKLCASIDLPEAALPIPPYALGAWLGDGASATGLVTMSVADAEEVVELLAANGQPAYSKIAQASRPGVASIILSEKGIHWTSARYRFRDQANKLGVLGNKHIPTIYLRASERQRLDLLRGLMDTDGGISKAGQASITTILPKLRDGVVELINSLGLKASVSEHRAKIYGRDCGPYWFIQFWPFSGIQVFSLKRKVDAQRPFAAKYSPRSSTRQIVAARRVASVPVQCISVDSPGKQYLITRSLIPTHNTTSSAAIMMVALIVNRRPDGEYVLIAPTKEIADIAYRQASGIIRADPELGKIFHNQAHIRRITHRVTGALLQVKAADTDVISGGKQTGALIDELHVLAAKSNADEILLEIRGALAARPDGFLITVTTQSKKPPQGIFKSELAKARNVRDGKLKQSLLPVLYELPDRLAGDGGWKNKKFWGFVNPNLGRSVSEDFLDRELAASEETGVSQLALFASQHFNVEIGLGLRADAWPGARFWEACGDPSLTLDALISRSEVAVVGIDGGGLDDLLGLAVVGRERGTGNWLCWAHAYAHESVLEVRKSEAQKLRDFARDGDVTIVSMMETAFEAVADIAARLDEEGILATAGLDPIGVAEIVDALAKRGIEGNDRVLGIAQGFRLNGVIKTAENKLSDGKLAHSGSGLMAWCASNAKVEAKGNAFLITKAASGTAKIDPLMAMFNAVALMSRNPEPKNPISIYETQDLRTIAFS